MSVWPVGAVAMGGVDARLPPIECGLERMPGGGLIKFIKQCRYYVYGKYSRMGVLYSIP